MGFVDTEQLIGGRYSTIKTFQLKGWTSRIPDFHLTMRYRQANCNKREQQKLTVSSLIWKLAHLWEGIHIEAAHRGSHTLTVRPGGPVSVMPGRLPGLRECHFSLTGVAPRGPPSAPGAPERSQPWREGTSSWCL